MGKQDQAVTPEEIRIDGLSFLDLERKTTKLLNFEWELLLLIFLRHLA